MQNLVQKDPKWRWVWKFNDNNDWQQTNELKHCLFLKIQKIKYFITKNVVSGIIFFYTNWNFFSRYFIYVYISSCVLWKCDNSRLATNPLWESIVSESTCWRFVYIPSVVPEFIEKALILDCPSIHPRSFATQSNIKPEIS